MARHSSWLSLWAGTLALTAAMTACTTTSTTYRLDDLQRDYAEVETAVLTRHPFPLGNREEVAALFSVRYNLLSDGMTAWEFLRVLSPAVAGVRCGHTSISPSDGLLAEMKGRARLLPVQVIAADDRLYALRDFSTTGIPPGSEILSINGKTAAEVISALMQSMTADGWNLTSKYRRINELFAVWYCLYIDNPASFTVAYAPPGGILASTASIRAWGYERVLSAAGAAGPTAGGASLPYSGSVESGYAVLKIASFSFYDAAGRRAFETFIDGFFDSTAAAGVQDLILDLRGNSGGDPYCAAALFKRLISGQLAYFSVATPGYSDLKMISPARNRFTGRLYLLIDSGCFSTTGHLCSLLRYHGIGTFVGEETAGSYSCTDNSKNITLSRTGLVLRLSTTVYATAVSGLTPGRGILPDYEVVPTIEDRLAGTDVQMAFAVNLIRRAAETR
jgi:hypothetical protein